MLTKIRHDHKPTMILIAACWQTQLWYPKVMSMLVATPLLIKNTPRLLVDLSDSPHPLALNKTLTLVARKVSGRNRLTEEFLNKQPDLLPRQEE